MEHKSIHGSRLTLVPNEEKYYSFILNLRNNPEVKQGFINQDHIDIESHFTFMKNYGSMYYICLLDGTPAGFVGQIDKDIRIATHPDFQGRGVARFMIVELMKLHPDSIAKVKVKNQASLRLFESCGFKKRYFILEKDNAS